MRAETGRALDAAGRGGKTPHPAAARRAWGPWRTWTHGRGGAHGSGSPPPCRGRPPLWRLAGGAVRGWARALRAAGDTGAGAPVGCRRARLSPARRRRCRTVPPVGRRSAGAGRRDVLAAGAGATTSAPRSSGGGVVRVAVGERGRPPPGPPRGSLGSFPAACAPRQGGRRRHWSGPPMAPLLSRNDCGPCGALVAAACDAPSVAVSSVHLRGHANLFDVVRAVPCVDFAARSSDFCLMSLPCPLPLCLRCQRRRCRCHSTTWPCVAEDR